jgi:hypothetical protein
MRIKIEPLKITIPLDSEIDVEYCPTTARDSQSIVAAAGIRDIDARGVV